MAPFVGGSCPYLAAMFLYFWSYRCWTCSVSLTPTTISWGKVYYVFLYVIKAYLSREGFQLSKTGWFSAILAYKEMCPTSTHFLHFQTYCKETHFDWSATFTFDQAMLWYTVKAWRSFEGWKINQRSTQHVGPGAVEVWQRQRWCHNRVLSGIQWRWMRQ